MHKTYEEAISNLERTNCQVYATNLVKIIAALQEAVDECVPPHIAKQIGDRFLALSHQKADIWNTPK